jgi:hypothetical protein
VSVSQYLERHAEPEAKAVLAPGLQGSWGHALVVPAYGEETSLFPLLGSVPSGPKGDVLIAVVLNAREDSPPKIHAANAAVRERLVQELPEFVTLSESPAIRAHRLSSGTLLVFDRAVPGAFLPEGQGVGLARKIGNDAVLELAAAGRVATPWLHNTDADVLLPRDYFEQLSGVDAAGVGSAIYAWDHRFEEDPVLAEAGRLYEISLRYYVLGLAWAGSPYAYESMGSALAIPAESYAAVRGFPRKNAAEDFYVLDKLAKVGSIVRLDGTRLLLEGRPSDRVPFGTGRALLDLVGKKNGLERFRLHHPLVFAHVAQWLRVLDAVARSGGSLEAGLAELPSGNPFFRAGVLEEALGGMGAFEAVREAIAATKDADALRRRLHTWFDAFRTLKLVHALRDAGFPSMPWRQALTEAPFTNLTASTEDETDVLRRELAVEESKLAATKAGVPALPEWPAE